MNNVFRYCKVCLIYSVFLKCYLNILFLSICMFSIRRADRRPSSSSRICSCHFTKGKEKGPLWSAWHGPLSSEAHVTSSSDSRDSPEEGCRVNEAHEVSRGVLSDPSSEVFTPEVQAIVEESEVTDGQAKLQSSR